MVLVTGSSGHLGRALIRALQVANHRVVGVDKLASRFTQCVGSVADRAFVRNCMQGVDAVIHSASLHAPHVGTHTRREFTETNVVGTRILLEEAVAAGVSTFVLTSTTCVYGRALIPATGAPAAWIRDYATAVPTGVYGDTKAAAEGLCALFHRTHELACIILRTSSFAPAPEYRSASRGAYADDNIQANECLNCRVGLQDVVDAHVLALQRAQRIGFAQYVISASTPFQPEDLLELRLNAPAVVERRVPEYLAEYTRRGWTMSPGIDHVLVNKRARHDLGWTPKLDFRALIAKPGKGNHTWNPMVRSIGSRRCEPFRFAGSRYPDWRISPAMGSHTRQRPN